MQNKHINSRKNKNANKILPFICGVARKTIEILKVKTICNDTLAEASGVKICLNLIEVGCCVHSFTFSSMTLCAYSWEDYSQGESDRACCEKYSEHEKFKTLFPLDVIGNKSDCCWAWKSQFWNFVDKSKLFRLSSLGQHNCISKGNPFR